MLEKKNIVSLIAILLHMLFLLVGKRRKIRLILDEMSRWPTCQHKVEIFSCQLKINAQLGIIWLITPRVQTSEARADVYFMKCWKKWSQVNEGIKFNI